MSTWPLAFSDASRASWALLTFSVSWGGNSTRRCRMSALMAFSATGSLPAFRATAAEMPLS